ncbi:wHTH domain-containing protein [Parafrankia discariae]|uniref:wHTH domain-containing protein n=1 Tax=Parafrankia discariae TaxID=365528 RepID=UPI0003712D15|nr:TIR domain-containing protein [Parafrankia discariae]
MHNGGNGGALPGDRWSFFVSYTQADRAWAEWIAWQLEDAGFRVLVQAWDMVAGSNWTATMQDGMQFGTRTIAILSDAYLQSVYGRHEWQAAVVADPDSARRKLLPVRVEDCDRPGLLGQVVSVDLFGQPAEATRSTLLTAIRGAVSGRAKPSDEPLFPGPLATPIPPQAPPPRVAPLFPGAAEPAATTARRRQPVRADTSAVPARRLVHQAADPAPAAAGGEFRALLVGVAAYDDDRLPSLPDVTEAIDTTVEALEAVGYRVEIQDRSRLGLSAVKSAIHAFISGAAPGDTLLLVLAGHGVHSGRRDYLVPSDAAVGYQPFWDLCVPVDWTQAVSRSAAARVLVVVDAAVAFDDDVRDLVTEAGWAGGPLDTPAGTDLAYLYVDPSDPFGPVGPAGPGEPAEPGGTEEPGGTAGGAGRASLLRAMVDVASHRPLPAGLEELRAALTTSLGHGDQGSGSGAGRGRGTSGRAPSCLLRASSRDPRLFTVFPAAAVGQQAGRPVHPWQTVAERHSAWTLSAEAAAGDPRAGDELRESTLRLIGRLGRVSDDAAGRLRGDPWHDPGLAARMTKRVEFLVNRLPAEADALSPAEAALLVSVPFLHQAVWTRLVARAALAHPGSPSVWTDDVERGEFEAFLRLHPRLRRRAERARRSGDQQSAAAIGWWLAHQWIISRSASYAGTAFADLLTGLGVETVASEVFLPGRLAELLTALRAAPTFLGRPGRSGALRDLVLVAPATGDEMPLRERLVGYLLAAGQRMALEPAALPSVLVEHLGVADPVRLDELRETIRRAEWQHRGRSSRALAARCGHQAVQVALEHHVAALDTLFAEAHRATAETPALAALPTHATADRIHAAEVNGRAVYSAAGAQFRLAEDKVQELLMGEQLYANRALAVRELYQNALDACRYRRAREEYLERTGAAASGWAGEITFRQGFEPDGAPYIECRDNGIGMGLRELSDVFAEAGTRAVDLPEVVEEMVAWAACDPPVEFHPNSRFGVGVLSYFMIADEIDVETCRLGPDGRPGDRLRVTIAGPGNLFRIRNLGPGRDAGTTVRLYPSRDPQSSPVSCVDTLRRILWVAEFDTRATEGVARQFWPAGRLADSAPVGMEHPLTSTLRRETTQIVMADNGVWWCDGTGAVLADGLWVGRTAFGVVLNLTGPLVPELSVDRNEIRRFVDGSAIDAVLTGELSVLRSAASFDVSWRWLASFGLGFPLVADAVMTGKVADGESWTRVDGDLVPVEQVGCLAFDHDLLPSAVPAPAGRSGRYTAFDLTDLSDSVVFARMRGWVVGRSGDPERTRDSGRALPSDMVILGVRGDGSQRYGYSIGDLSTVVFMAGMLRSSPQRVRDRMSGLGISVASVKGVAVDELGDIDLQLVSADLDGEEAMFYSAGDVTPLQVARATQHLMLSFTEVRDRYRELGFEVRPAPTQSMTIDPLDLVLLSRSLDGRGGALPGGRVGLSHVVRAAIQTGRSVGDVCSRLRRFGYRTPATGCLERSGIRPDDAVIFGRDSTGALSAQPVPAVFLSNLGNHALESAGRLRDLGFPIADTIRVPVRDGRSPVDLFPSMGTQVKFRATSRPLDRVDVYQLAREASLGLERTAAHLRAAGYVVPNVSEIDDDRLLRIRGDRFTLGWLRAPVGIPGVLGLAQSLGGQPSEVEALLADLAIPIPDLAGIEMTTDDAIIFSSGLDGNIFGGLGAVGGVAVAHVIAAAARIRRRPCEVAARFLELGEPVADPDGWDATPVTPSDPPLLACKADSAVPWLPPGGVPGGQVIALAAHSGRSPREVGRRLAELGYQTGWVADVRLTAAEDRTLIDLLDVPDARARGRARASRASLLAAAWRHGRDPVGLARWLAGLGEDPGLEVEVMPRVAIGVDDLDLLSCELDGEPPWLPDGEIGTGHILAAAGRTGRSPAEIADRLGDLGFTVADLPHPVPTEVDAVDVILLSRDLDGGAPWLRGDRVPLAYVYSAACDLSCDVAEVRARYARLGFTAAGPTSELDQDERAFVTVAFHGAEIDSASPAACDTLSIAQVLGVAEFTGRPAAEVAHRFAKLGFTVPDETRPPIASPPDLSARDGLLLSAALDGSGPWLGPGPVPMAHVLAAAGRLRWTPDRVVGRFSELGYSTSPLVASARGAVIDGADRALAELLRDENDVYQERQVSWAEVLMASHRLRRRPDQIIARLAELGLRAAP